MYLAIRARTWLTAFAFVAAAAMPAAAQDVSDSHMTAAREAIDALTSTRQYDDILPQAAAALKQELIQKNPDMVSTITQLVDEKTLELASRRGDLEREAAAIYAKFFTEQQLNEMAAFYRTETGQKLLEDGGLVARQVHEAAGVWQRGIARDLAQSVATQLAEIVKAQSPQPEATEETAPAEETEVNQ